MATYNDRLDAIIMALGGDPTSRLYGEQLRSIAYAIGGVDLMVPQTLTEEEKATARNNIDVGSATVDSELSETSENPVQNKVIKAALDLKANASSLGNKLDKDQGVSRAGEFLIVGDDGKVTTQAFDTLEGGSY